MIQAAIHEVAAAGRAVIVAHAASMTLAGTEGVLRVLVTASAVTRARRVAASAGMSEAEATAAIAQADRNRQDYFRRFYEIREEQSTHYDLVINTDVLTAEQAGDLIVFAARGQI
jgi:cytidylate kinase